MPSCPPARRPARKRQISLGAAVLFTGILLVLATGVAALALGDWTSPVGAQPRASATGVSTGTLDPRAASAATTATTSSTTVSPSTAPPTTVPLTWVTSEISMPYGGLDRSYVLIRPSVASSEPLPVVVFLQGCCTSVFHEIQRDGFSSVTGPAILVYPVAYDPGPTEESWDAGHCCSVAQAKGLDDVGFVLAVVQQVLQTQHDADPSRVYLGGYSNGAKLALAIACADPSPFRAIAVYGGTAAEDCSQPKPASVAVIAARGDPELTIGPGGTPKVEDGFTDPTVTEEVHSYVEADGCSSASSASTAGNLVERLWSSCPGGRRVAMDIYTVGDHNWPLGSATTPSGAEAMWSFFTSTG